MGYTQQEIRSVYYGVLRPKNSTKHCVTACSYRSPSLNVLQKGSEVSATYG